MACTKSINILQQLKNCRSRLISTSARALCQTKDVTHTGQVIILFDALLKISVDYASDFFCVVFVWLDVGFRARRLS